MMDSLEKLSKQIAVRIAGNGGKDLIGSGAIMPCEPYKYALIFTAAHVLEDAGVFKRDAEGKAAFLRFIDSI